jgi:ferredoxin
LTSGLLAAYLYLNRKESTKKLARIHSRNPLRFLHGYIYFKWPEFYLRTVKKTLEDPSSVPRPVHGTCANYLLETHHSKVIPLDNARQLVKVEANISLTDLEQVIPFKKARDIVLQDPQHIAVADCMCRRIQEDSCQPLDVCIFVGEPFASFVVEHQTGHARWISPEEAISILEREHKRGRFHTAWFKDAAGDRFYSICNCCKCCCLGMRAYSLFDKRTITPSGYITKVDVESCTGCGECIEVCPFDALSVNEKAEINASSCMGCGLCNDKCGQNALTLHIDSSKPKPLDIQALAEQTT